MIAGLKLAGIVGAASAIAIGALWWQLGNAQENAELQRERAAMIKAHLDQARDVAHNNQLRVLELAAEMTRRDEILTDLEQQLETRRSETRELLTDLQEANSHAPVEYQDCLAVDLPASVRDLVGLRNDPGAGDRSGDGGPDRAHSPTGQLDAALPGA
ncbi:MAG TPA: hypothetical protein VIG24_02120 [Acidimicrobiia bacterium]